MVQSTVGDEFLLKTSGEALVGFTVGAAALTVITGGAGAAAGSAIAGCSVTGVVVGGALGGAAEYLAISGLANGINPAATNPTLEGTATAALTGAAGGLVGKWLGLLGCFVEGTEVTISSLPQSASIKEAVWTDWLEPSEPYIEAIVGGTEPQVAITTIGSLKVAIQHVPLGSLVPTKNPKPWEYDDSLPDPDESTWQQVTLTVERSDGATVDVELLRPSSWVEQNELASGRRLPIQIPELEVSGWATVHDVEACPTLAVGEGSFVTGRFVTRRVEQTIEIELEDGSAIEGTTNHPVWSLDRNDWAPLGELRVGELLQSEFGPIAVVTRRIHNRPTAVYNIEVQGEHVYQVGELGLLVHNACNLNLNDATADFGLYAIRINGHIWKIGKTHLGRITQSSGLPTRLHQQVRKLREVFGEANVVGELVQSLGRTTTKKAKEAEQSKIMDVFLESGFVPLGNWKSFFLWFFSHLNG
jgi:hypothetical protein